MTKVDNTNGYRAQNSDCDKAQKLKFGQNQNLDNFWIFFWRGGGQKVTPNEEKNDLIK